MLRKLPIIAYLAAAGFCPAAEPLVFPSQQKAGLLPDLELRRTLEPRARPDFGDLLSERLNAWIGMPPNLSVQITIGKRPEIWITLKRI